MPRTPSPVRVTSPTSPTISRNIILGGASAGFQLRHRRSSSASIAGEGGAWNLMSMKLTEPRLHGGETSEVQVCVNEEKDIGASGSDSHLMQLYR